MLKTTEVERKIREIKLLIVTQINHSSCRTLDHYFSPSLSNCYGTHEELRINQFFKNAQKFLESK